MSENNMPIFSLLCYILPRNVWIKPGGIFFTIDINNVGHFPMEVCLVQNVLS